VEIVYSFHVMSNLDDLKKAIADAPKRLVQINDKLFIYVGTETSLRADHAIKRALADGKTIIENGTSQWIEFWPVRDNNKSGSDAYTWRDGDSIRTEKILFTKNPKNKVTQKSLGFVWKDALTVI
jgi:hypothetical protein